MDNELITVEVFYREVFDTLSRYLDPGEVECLADAFYGLQSGQLGDVPGNLENDHADRRSPSPQPVQGEEVQKEEEAET